LSVAALLRPPRKEVSVRRVREFLKPMARLAACAALLGAPFLLSAGCEEDVTEPTPPDYGVDGALTPDLSCWGDMTLSCYNGPNKTQGVGACKAGYQACASGVWGACTGEVTPTKELCDGKDNDCDGLSDEGMAAYCYTGKAGTKGVGLCKEGIKICTSGAWGACAGEVIPTAEICDGLDNDCNGKIDDGLTLACYTGTASTSGVGLCKAGTKTCSAGKWSACTGEVTPATEICDNKDNDCNGKTDDNLSQACYTGAAAAKGVGLCTGGTQTCTAGKWGTCTGEVIPTKEICDNLDNDCNGKTDDKVTKPCYSGPAKTKGVGLCKAGKQTCAAGKWGACTGEVLPKAEKCNNKDNNCDGTKDKQEACYTGPKGTLNVGICKAGTSPCVSPSGPIPLLVGGCNNEVTPTGEDCEDKLDNDCDGKVDGNDSDCWAH